MGFRELTGKSTCLSVWRTVSRKEECYPEGKTDDSPVGRQHPIRADCKESSDKVFEGNNLRVMERK